MKIRLFGTVLLYLIMLMITIQTSTSFGASPDSKKRTLKSIQWNVSVDPSTLEVIAKPVNRKPSVISSPQKGFEDVSSLQAKGDSLAWSNRNRGLTFDLRLMQRELVIKITADRPHNLTFPVIHADDSLQAFILPHWEGIYVPVNDAFWKETLPRQTFNTTEGLTMPFWGLDLKTYTLTYIVGNRFNNELSFKLENDRLHALFNHQFKEIHKTKEISFIIKLGEDYSPVEPAKEYRRHLVSWNRHVPMSEKIKTVPKADWLRGAIHGYLWGSLQMSLDDVYPGKWKLLCKEIDRQAKANSPSPGLRIWELLSKNHRKEVVKLHGLKYRPYPYIRLEVSEGMSKVLSRRDFYKAAYFAQVKLPKELRQSLSKTELESSVPAEVFRLNSLVMYHSFPGVIRHPSEWGYGYSTRMLKDLKKMGIHRARLVHDIWDFGMIDYNPRVAIEANKLGYLLGPYDSYNSIHDPRHYGKGGSWSTAQYDEELYKTGGIQKKNGKYRTGFAGRGYKLNARAARPWVEKRVKRIMQRTPFNSYFIDCDAFGETYDDYSPLHPTLQRDDLKERVDRMKWIRDSFQLVIGSEGGSSFAAPVIHVAEGMFSTPFGKWMDPDFGDRKSEYYLGTWFPPYEPTIFTKQVPLKEKFVNFFYNPAYRLPLNEIVFHDSFVSTHHYQTGTRKFTNVRDNVELVSLLYLTPPMYHLNPDRLKKNKKEITRFYKFFHPLHKKMGFDQMTEFTWLSEDRLIQKTTFGDDLEMIANFGESDVTISEIRVPAKSITAHWPKSGSTSIYTPGYNLP